MKVISQKIVSMLLIAVSIVSVFSPAASAYTSEFNEAILGDANMDNKITLKDASLVQRASILLEDFDDNQVFLADVDGESGISLKDAYIIQRYSLGIKADYPKNLSGASIGDTVYVFEEIIDSDSDITDTDTDETDTENTDTAVSDTEETNTDVPETDTAETDSLMSDSDAEDTDSVMTESDTEQTDSVMTESDTEDTDSLMTESDTEETDSDITETDTEDTESDEPVIELPLEQINEELNGGFEYGGDMPDSWEKSGVHIAVSRAQGEGVNGSACLKINNSTNYVGMGIRRVSGLKPNTDYKFTVKVRINSVVKEKNLNGAAVDVGPFTQHYYSELKNEDGSVEQAKGYMMYTTENWFDGTFDWREVTCYFVSDRKGRADILLYLEGKGTAWFDDVVIAPADFDSEVTEVRRVEGEHTAVIVYTKDIEGLDEQALHNWVRKLDYAYDQMADRKHTFWRG